jgi:hypothetical protein
MPLKLAVMALVLALAMPLLAEASSGFERDVLRERCRRLAEAVRDRAEEAVAAGPGNVRVLLLSEIAGSAGLRLRLGGLGDEKDRIAVSTDSVLVEVRCVAPRVLFNSTLDAEAGPWLLYLEAIAPGAGSNMDARRMT